MAPIPQSEERLIDGCDRDAKLPGDRQALPPPQHEEARHRVRQERSVPSVTTASLATMGPLRSRGHTARLPAQLLPIGSQPIPSPS